MMSDMSFDEDELGIIKTANVILIRFILSKQDKIH